MDWNIDTIPEWGEWTFNPTLGEDLTPNQGEIFVTVTVIVPDESDSTLTGELKVVNSEEPDDYEIIQVSLSTDIKTKNNYTFFNLSQNQINKISLLSINNFINL